MGKARIPIPGANDPLGVLTLTANVAKGIADKDKDSLIVGELATELQAVAALVPDAIKAHNDAKELEKKLEKLYEKRNNAVNKAIPLLQRGSKSLQGNLGTARLREMGDYGYTVDDSPRPPKSPKEKR